MDEDQALSADNFAEMLGGEGDNEQTDDSDSQNADDAQETEQEAATEDDTDDAQDGEEGDEDGEQDEQPEKDSTDAFLELEINGEKVKLSKDEVKNGYLRQQDYTQKAQTLAKDRQNWQAHVQQQAAEVQQFSQELGSLTSIDEALQQYQQINWQQLRDEDPINYAAHATDFQNLKASRNDLVASIQQKQQNLEQARKQTFHEQSLEAQAHMAKVVPGFGKEHIKQINDFAMKQGFTANELKNVADKRMIETLWKAAQYDKSQAATKQAIKKVSALPTKANKPAPASKPASQLNTEKQLQRLKKTGSVRDFGALLGAPPKG